MIFRTFKPTRRHELRLTVIQTIAQLQRAPTPEIHIIERKRMKPLLQRHLAATLFAGMRAVIVDDKTIRYLQPAPIVGSEKKAVDPRGRHLDEPAKLQPIRVGVNIRDRDIG